MAKYRNKTYEFEAVDIWGLDKKDYPTSIIEYIKIGKIRMTYDFFGNLLEVEYNNCNDYHCQVEKGSFLTIEENGDLDSIPKDFLDNNYIKTEE